LGSDWPFSTTLHTVTARRPDQEAESHPRSGQASVRSMAGVLCCLRQTTITRSSACCLAARRGLEDLQHWRATRSNATQQKPDSLRLTSSIASLDLDGSFYLPQTLPLLVRITRTITSGFCFINKQTHVHGGEPLPCRTLRQSVRVTENFRCLT
jgi:hypothetical protein